jgi:hypothetical protein
MGCAIPLLPLSTFMAWKGTTLYSLFFSCGSLDLIIEATRSRSDLQQLVGLLWTSGQPYADFYLTTHNTSSRQTSMPPTGFEPRISCPQTHVLARAALGAAPFFIHFYFV